MKKVVDERSDRGGGDPFLADHPGAPYLAIKATLAAEISAGRWVPGGKLPSESALVARFGVARMTVNRALRELAEEGRIRRVAGVGSFVEEARPRLPLLLIRSIDDEIAARGGSHHAQVLVHRSLPVPQEVALALALPREAAAFFTRLVHRDGASAIQIEERWVSPLAAPGYLALDPAVETPSRWLTSRITASEIEHVVEAAAADAAQAKLLDLPVDAPLLILRRRTWAAEQPVTLATFVHPAARFSFAGRFRTGAGAASRVA